MRQVWTNVVNIRLPPLPHTCICQCCLVGPLHPFEQSLLLLRVLVALRDNYFLGALGLSVPPPCTALYITVSLCTAPSRRARRLAASSVSAPSPLQGPPVIITIVVIRAPTSSSSGNPALAPRPLPLLQLLARIYEISRIYKI